MRFGKWVIGQFRNLAIDCSDYQFTNLNLQISGVVVPIRRGGNWSRRELNYIVMTKDGRIYDGILANETPGAVTLRGTSDEGEITLLRRNISEIRASTISLMPEELEKSLNHQALADVIAYLQGGL